MIEEARTRTRAGARHARARPVGHATPAARAKGRTGLQVVVHLVDVHQAGLRFVSDASSATHVTASRERAAWPVPPPAVVSRAADDGSKQQTATKRAGAKPARHSRAFEHLLLGPTAAALSRSTPRAPDVSRHATHPPTAGVKGKGRDSARPRLDGAPEGRPSLAARRRALGNAAAQGLPPAVVRLAQVPAAPHASLGQEDGRVALWRKPCAQLPVAHASRRCNRAGASTSSDRCPLI